jgi:hypothetical protein
VPALSRLCTLHYVSSDKQTCSRPGSAESSGVDCGPSEHEPDPSVGGIGRPVASPYASEVIPSGRAEFRRGRVSQTMQSVMLQPIRCFCRLLMDRAMCPAVAMARMPCKSIQTEGIRTSPSQFVVCLPSAACGELVRCHKTPGNPLTLYREPMAPMPAAERVDGLFAKSGQQLSSDGPSSVVGGVPSLLEDSGQISRP